MLEATPPMSDRILAHVRDPRLLDADRVGVQTAASGPGGWVHMSELGQKRQSSE